MFFQQVRVAAISAKVFFLSLVLVLVGEGITLSVSYHTAYPLMLVLGGERLLLAATLLMVAAPGGQGLSSFGLSRDRFADGLKRGLIWSVFAGLAGLLFFVILYAARISPLALVHSRLPGDGLELVLFFLVGGLIGPLAEEIFFRGIVYGFLRRWGVLLALVGTTVLFVAAHLKNVILPLSLCQPFRK